MMNRFIEVYDNILDPKLVNKIENKTLYGIPYFYLHNITSLDSDEYLPGLSHHFFDSDGFLNKNSFSFLSQILYRFCQHRNICIHQIIQGRCFLHISPSPISTPDSIHTDLNHPHWVCLYYTTDSDGDTILYEDDEITEIKRISPKKGRIVFFDGSIKHCSSKPTKTHRSIVNFDFLGEFLEE